MKQRKRAIGIGLLAIVVCTLCLTGCDQLEKAKGVVLKAYIVVCDLEVTLAEVETLIAGSPLADKLQPQIDQVKASIAVIKDTLERIAALIGLDLVLPVRDAAQSSLERLKASTKQLEEENAKLKAKE